MAGTRFDHWSASHSHISSPFLPGSLGSRPAAQRPYIIGIDRHQVSVPQGQKFSETKITKTGGNAFVRADPNPGDTGGGEVMILWTCKAGATVKYDVEVFSEPLGSPTPSVVTIDITDADAISKLAFAMNRRQKIKFRMGGADAQKLL